MKLISSQPDEPYFLWQLQVQLRNFHRYDLERDYIVLIGVRGEPSALAKSIAERSSAQVVFVPDTRSSRRYTPSIQPHVYAKYFASHAIDEPLLFIDSDVVFTSAPNFDHLLEDDICYLSNTIGYIGYDYVVSKGAEQLADMCKLVGVTVDTVRENQPHSGGAQYLLKGCADAALWSKIEQDGNRLYDYMHARESTWKGQGYPIQKWTAGMWAMLWNLWLHGKQTRVVDDLDFTWGSDTIEQMRSKPKSCMLHLAGVTADMAATHFYKGAYVHRHPFDNLEAIFESMPDVALNGSHVYCEELYEAASYWKAS